MTQSQLEKYLWGAATQLRGTIDAGDYKQYIFPLLFFKRICDVYDEEFEKALEEGEGDMEYAAFAEHHHFQVPEDAHWNKVRETTTNVGMAIQEAMRAIEKANPDTLYGIFGDSSWTNKDRLSDETLTNLIEHYSQHKLSLSNVADDKLGNAYEYLIKEFADDSGHTAAEFYTNRTVVKLMTLIMTRNRARACMTLRAVRVDCCSTAPCTSRKKARNTAPSNSTDKRLTCLPPPLPA
jgi:type I restriction enzyme M protein